MPLPVIMGPHGTGKSDLLKQLGRMVKEPEEVSVQTKAALQDKLHNTFTALIDEGGEIDEEWLEYSEKQIENDVPLKTIRDELKSNFDIYLKNVQLQSACEALGFTVVSHSGYPKVKSNVKLLKKLFLKTGDCGSEWF